MRWCILWTCEFGILGAESDPNQVFVFVTLQHGSTVANIVFE